MTKKDDTKKTDEEIKKEEVATEHEDKETGPIADEVQEDEDIKEGKKEKEEKKESKKTEELEEKLKEKEEQYKRALADYQNLEKRVREERVNWIKIANKELLLRLLPILDTIVLAQKHTKDQNIQVTLQLFLDILKQEGVEKIETKDKEFDPHLMEGVGASEGKEGIVLEEARAGYKIGDKVLRPAQVIVGSPTVN